MTTVKKTAQYTITKKRSGRYAVVDAQQKYVKAQEKVEILLKEGLIKLTAPKKAEEAPAA